MKSNCNNRPGIYARSMKGLLVHFFSIVYVISFANALPVSGEDILQRRSAITGHNWEIKSVLKKIEPSPIIRFACQPQAVNTSHDISPAVKDTPLVKEYSMLFAPAVLYGEMDNWVMINGDIISALHEITVSGKITDAGTGESLPGVNVAVKGTTQGTTTDSEGHYTLVAADENAVLVFTFVGYIVQEIPIGLRSVIDVQLTAEQKQLEEVVVVGYGTEKKASLTSSVATLGGAEVLRSSTTPNISNVFAGQVPGVIANNRSGRPGNDQSTISIRGSNSFSGGTDPLYVIDGIQDRNIDRINPADIESITVLKDASAAIYGVRAANGVILVTTKRGKSGKPQITYDGSASLQALTRVDSRVNAAQYMTYFNEIDAYKGSPLTYSQPDIAKYKAGNDPKYSSTNWFKEVFRDIAPQTNHSLSVRGGSDAVKFYISGQYLTQQSLWANSDEKYKNLNVRSNLDAMITKNLKVTLDLAVRKEDRLYPAFPESDILHQTVSMYPFIPVKWANGMPSAGLANGFNPYLMTSSAAGYNSTIDYFVQPKLAFDWQLPGITKGLFLTGWTAQDYNARSQKVFHKQWDAYNYNRTTDTYSNQRSSTPVSSISQNESTFNYSTYFIKLGYEREFGLHNINAFAGYEQISQTSRGTTAYRQNLLSNELDQLFTGSTVDQNAQGSGGQDGRESYLGRLAYSYADKYLLEVTGRYNGSFNFPPDKRWGLFPSVSAGWRISNENFLKDNVPFINRLLLRASWGIMGSDNIDQYQYLNRYQLNTVLQNNIYFGPGYLEAKTLHPVSSPNPNITWEKQNTGDAGFDAVLFNNKLTLAFDYFRNYRTDILAARNASVPAYSGLTLPKENIGISQNQGFDFLIKYSGNTHSFNYYAGFNFTYAKNTIVFQDEAANIPGYQRGTGNPIGSWVVYQTNGIYHTTQEVDNSPHLAGAQPGDLWIIDKNNDKTITWDDQVRIPYGNVPQMVGGVTMGAGSKGFALDLVWSAQTKVKQMIISQAQSQVTAPPQWLYDGRWTIENTNASLPRAFNSNDARNDVYADFWLKDASFVRLKSAQLSYTVPAHFMAKTGLTGFRLYFSAFNLFSIDYMRKYERDPETSNITGNGYPQSRIFRAGITLGL